jgi:hypothetical protein
MSVMSIEIGRLDAITSVIPFEEDEWLDGVLNSRWLEACHHATPSIAA